MPTLTILRVQALGQYARVEQSIPVKYRDGVWEALRKATESGVLTPVYTGCKCPERMHRVLADLECGVRLVVAHGDTEPRYAAYAVPVKESVEHPQALAEGVAGCAICAGQWGIFPLIAGPIPICTSCEKDIIEGKRDGDGAGLVCWFNGRAGLDNSLIYATFESAMEAALFSYHALREPDVRGILWGVYGKHGFEIVVDASREHLGSRDEWLKRIAHGAGVSFVAKGNGILPEAVLPEMAAVGLAFEAALFEALPHLGLSFEKNVASGAGWDFKPTGAGWNPLLANRLINLKVSGAYTLFSTSGPIMKSLDWETPRTQFTPKEAAEAEAIVRAEIKVRKLNEIIFLAPVSAGVQTNIMHEVRTGNWEAVRDILRADSFDFIRLGDKYDVEFTFGQGRLSMIWLIKGGAKIIHSEKPRRDKGKQNWRVQFRFAPTAFSRLKDTNLIEQLKAQALAGAAGLLESAAQRALPEGVVTSSMVE